MHFSTLSLTLSLLSFALAQSSTTVDGTIHKVDVGEDGKLVFNPDSITAAVGDFVEWHFYATSHSVNEASFDAPCAPITGAFSSGLITTTTGENAKVFRIMVNSTEPLWYYCGFTGHCQSGMVGVINPPSDETVQQFAAAAANAPLVAAPASVNGGVVGPAAVQASSSTESSAVQASTSATESSTVQVSTSTESSAVQVSTSTESSTVQASTSATQSAAVNASTSASQSAAVNASISATQSAATPSFTQVSGIDSRSGVQWVIFGMSGLVAAIFGSLIV